MIKQGDILQDIKNGVDILANAVGSTYGPRGKNVCIEKGERYPVLTKDGVTVARAVEVKDPYQALGVGLAKQASIETATEAGDGTTGAAILTQALVNGGENIESVWELQDGMRLAAQEAIDQIKTSARPVDDLETKIRVATIAANNKVEIGKLVGELVHKVGTAPIDIQDSMDYGVSTEIAEGMKLERGLISEALVGDREKQELILNNPVILVYKGSLTDYKILDAFLGKIVPKTNEILIIADSYSDTVKDYIIRSSQYVMSVGMQGMRRGTLNIGAIESPGYAEKREEYVKDVCALVNTQAINSLEIEIETLGTCERIVLTPNSTQIIGGADVKDRVKELEAQYKNSTGFDAEQLRERIAKLTTGVGIIKVGAATEAELKPLKDLLDDAVRATQSAIEEGVVEGGGVALARVKLGSGNAGYELFKSCKTALFTKLMENAGLKPELPETGGVDARTGQPVDMWTAGIIDPMKVVRSIIERAVSAAGEILTIEVGIVPDKEEK